MLDPENDLIPQSSPSISSSVSSSDLDTESTGSFFHDRSTTLGTLMGLNFPSISVRVSSRRENNANAATGTTTDTTSSTATSNARGGRRKKSKKKVVAIEAAADRRRSWWWKLCRDDVDTTTASLGEFLQVERRYEEEVEERGFYGATEAALEFETVLNHQRTENNNGNGNGNGNGGSAALFADGRVLPPPTEVGRPSVDVGGVRRFPVLLTGICSGGGGGS